MEYKLYKAAINRNATVCSLWFTNPNCVFEEPHKLVFFSPHPVIDIMMSVVWDGSRDGIDINNVPLNIIPEELQTIHASYVNVAIGLHRHATEKASGGRPKLTTSLNIFAPMTQVERPCDNKMVYEYIKSPQQIAREIINKEWIPVEED